MPRDARLGLVVGVALVIVIAVIFYHGDGTAGTAGNVGTRSPTLTGREVNKAAPTSPQPTPAPGLPPTARIRSHVVQEGETLSSLATHYYGDAALSSLLFRANRSQLRSPGADLPVGAVLVIPEATGESE
jgi:nucleoid-associated protein YgaU